MSNNITDKQSEFIKLIEMMLNIKFNGRTKKEASKFISDNIEAYRMANTRTIDFDIFPFEKIEF